MIIPPLDRWMAGMGSIAGAGRRRGGAELGGLVARRGLGRLLAARRLARRAALAGVTRHHYLLRYTTVYHRDCSGNFSAEFISRLTE